MEDTMKVLELLEELEDIVDAATKVPMMSKVMIYTKSKPSPTQ